MAMPVDWMAAIPKFRDVEVIVWDADALLGDACALAKDAMAVLGFLDGLELAEPVAGAARLLATLVGQDLDSDEAGVFRIARRVAKDRVISTVDPQARHGHKTAARGFDGYKGHLAIDPDTEIITATTVTAGNTGDADPATTLLAADLPTPAPVPGVDDSVGGPENVVVHEAQRGTGRGTESLAVYGDAAYGAGALLAVLEQAGASVMVKVQPPVAPAGRFAKDRFVINVAAATVSCPANATVPLRPAKGGGSTGRFGARCTTCPLAPGCTKSRAGRTIKITRYEAELTRARTTQRDPDWRAEYRATRPKVERKIAHLMRRKHGGRRARVRGTDKVAADFSLLAAAINLARLAVLGITRTTRSGWTVATA